jgi:hypothetical protein
MRVIVRRPTLVWGLLLCLVLVNGFMAAPSVSHAAHHADHQAGTHSTGICAWMCAAGEDIESSVSPFASSLQLIEHASILSFKPVLSAAALLYFFRGPPSFLLSLS